MYSIFEAKGYQHRAETGSVLRLPKLEAEVGSEVTFDKVLVIGGIDSPEIGGAVADGATIKVEILAHGRSDKIIVFKKKRRKDYKRTIGHRQHYTEVLVKEITGAGKTEKIDSKQVTRERARIKALKAMKEQKTKLTKKEKIATASSQGESNGA